MTTHHRYCGKSVLSTHFGWNIIRLAHVIILLLLLLLQIRRHPFHSHSNNLTSNNTYHICKSRYKTIKHHNMVRNRIARRTFKSLPSKILLLMSVVSSVVRITSWYGHMSNPLTRLTSVPLRGTSSGRYRRSTKSRRHSPGRYVYILTIMKIIPIVKCNVNKHLSRIVQYHCKKKRSIA